MQRSFIYFPSPKTSFDLTNRYFEFDDQKIAVTELNKHQERVLLYFGGNAENVDHNAELFKHTFSQYTVIMVKYRGYGASSGSPTEAALYNDAIRIYDQIALNRKNISVIGRSLGSAVATFLAANRKIEKLALITPFDSIQSLAQSQFPIFPMQILLKDKHNSLARAAHIDADTLVLLAESDEVVPLSHSQRLLDAFDKNIQVETLLGVDHNSVSNSPRYYELLADFFSQQTAK